MTNKNRATGIPEEAAIMHSCCCCSNNNGSGRKRATRTSQPQREEAWRAFSVFLGARVRPSYVAFAGAPRDSCCCCCGIAVCSGGPLLLLAAGEQFQLSVQCHRMPSPPTTKPAPSAWTMMADLAHCSSLLLLPEASLAAVAT